MNRHIFSLAIIATLAIGTAVRGDDRPLSPTGSLGAGARLAPPVDGPGAPGTPVNAPLSRGLGQIVSGWTHDGIHGEELAERIHRLQRQRAEEREERLRAPDRQPRSDRDDRFRDRDDDRNRDRDRDDGRRDRDRDDRVRDRDRDRDRDGDRDDRLRDRDHGITTAPEIAMTMYATGIATVIGMTEIATMIGATATVTSRAIGMPGLIGTILSASTTTWRTKPTTAATGTTI